MARNKTAVLLISLVFLAGLGAALDFSVEVRPTPEVSVYKVEGFNSTDFNSSMSLENSGSVGCSFRVRGDFKQGGQEIVRYSRPYSLWSGATEDAEIFYIPVNYTGEVNADLRLEYCDQEKDLGNFSFNSTERIVPNKTVESKTLDLNTTNAVVSIPELDDAILVPQKYPAYWKVGAAELEDGRSTINYEAPIFKQGENITYTILKNGSVEGETRVTLRDQETAFEELLRKLKSFF